MNRSRNQEEPMKEPPDIAVDRWVHQELARSYNGVLEEEIPEQLIRLLGSLETTYSDRSRD